MLSVCRHGRLLIIASQTNGFHYTITDPRSPWPLSTCCNILSTANFENDDDMLLLWLACNSVSNL